MSFCLKKASHRGGWVGALLFLTLISCKSGGEKAPVSTDLSLDYAQTISDANLALMGKDYQHIAVDASVYSGLMEMLGVSDKCIDFSNQNKLDVEKVIAAMPDLIMLSAYEGADIEKFKKLGIPVVECTDFLESSPLGRAEWMRFFGRLWGVGEKSDSLFAVVEKSYKALSNASQKKPQVIFDTLYGNIWYQPSPKSTMGQLVSDAGGAIPFESNQEGGSLSLSAEQVLMKAQNAEFWFIRSYGNQPLTLASLAKMNPAYGQFKAFKEGNVFVCYTDKTHFFEETPFRPDWLLHEMQTIFASEFGETKDLKYFCKIE